jgi:hypothetical protein
MYVYHAAGGQITPLLKVVEINHDLLARAPRRIPINLPGGVTITAVRRPDHDRLARTAMAAPMTPQTQQQQLQQQRQHGGGDGGAAIWVGEVLGARGGLSSVVLVSSESGALYGNVRYYDQKTDSIKAYTLRKGWRGSCGFRQACWTSLQGLPITHCDVSHTAVLLAETLPDTAADHKQPKQTLHAARMPLSRPTHQETPHPPADTMRRQVHQR